MSDRSTVRWRDLPDKPTTQQLRDSGYCVLQTHLDETGNAHCTLSRLNRNNWHEWMMTNQHSLGTARLEVDPDSPVINQLAHFYRLHLGSRMTGVPVALASRLETSESPEAPTTFLYHWRYPEKQKEQQKSRPAPKGYLAPFDPSQFDEPEPSKEPSVEEELSQEDWFNKLFK